MARTHKDPRGGFVTWDSTPTPPNQTVVYWAKHFVDNARWRGLNQRWTPFFGGKPVQSAGAWCDPIVSGACTLPPGDQCYEVLPGNVVRFDVENTMQDVAYDTAVKAYHPPLLPQPPPPPPKLLDPPPKGPIHTEPEPWHPPAPGGPPPVPHPQPEPGTSLHFDTYAPIALIGVAGVFAGFAFFRR